jgi:hypothetical protein
MVLVPARTRKGQTILTFAQEASPIWVPHPATVGIAVLSFYCAVTLSVISSELEIGFAPPVVALIVTA